MRDAGNMDIWTDARVDQLKALYADGLSSSQIACAIGGLTRNAVIGKVHRLGLRRPKSAPSLPPQPTSSIAIGPTVSRQADGGLVEKVRFGVKARKALADKDRATTQRIANAHLRKAQATPKRVKNKRAPGEFLGVAFMDLLENDCRFPKGEGSDIRFCGQPAVEGHSYCMDCCKVVYQPPYARRDNSPAPAHFAGPGRGTAWV